MCQQVSSRVPTLENGVIPRCCNTQHFCLRAKGSWVPIPLGFPVGFARSVWVSSGPLASSHSPKLTSGVNGCLSWICRWAWHGALGLAADSSQLHKVQFCLPSPLPRPKPPLILHPSLPLPLFSMTSHQLLTNVCPLQPSQFCCCV